MKNEHLKSLIAFCMLGTVAQTAFSQLVVDRATGAVEIAPFGDSVELNGYSIGSANGLLDIDAWTSLSAQEVDGWATANPRAELLSELNPLGFSATSAPFSLGQAYLGTTAPRRDEDLTFEYTLTDGSVVEGTVEYVGAINDLVLRVDPMTGAGAIELTSENVGPFQLVGYSIFSDGEQSLNFDGFTGLAGAEGWTIASVAPVSLAELNFMDGGSEIAVGSSVQIGTVFVPGSEQDLRFEFATAAGDFLEGSVLFAEAGTSNPLDCNLDGAVTLGDANCTPDAELDAFLAGLNPPLLRGDANGDGNVNVSDFLTLSRNFNQAAQYTDGDFNKSGTVDVSDFLVLSRNFNKTATTAAAVPEPSGSLLALLPMGVAMMLVRRRRNRSLLPLLLFAVTIVIAGIDSESQAQFDSRMIVLDAENPGPNAFINTAEEARGILRGTVTDVNIAEDVTGTVDFIDFAGEEGSLPINNPYPNGVNDTSLNNFVVQVTGHLQIPSGDWTIGFNSDDGGIISLPRIDFAATGNQNGATGKTGELIFNGTRGLDWTFGHFTVPAGETLRTEFEGIFFERSGDDGIEVAFSDGFVNGAELNDSGIELGADFLDWSVLEDGPEPGDFNWDDEVDLLDFMVLANNFGTGQSFAEGDHNRDGIVNLHDFAGFFPLLREANAGNAASVPEPATFQLSLIAFCSLLLSACRRRR